MCHVFVGRCSIAHHLAHSANVRENVCVRTENGIRMHDQAYTCQRIANTQAHTHPHVHTHGHKHGLQAFYKYCKKSIIKFFLQKCLQKAQTQQLEVQMTELKKVSRHSQKSSI
jgi:hypothetical protein